MVTISTDLKDRGGNRPAAQITQLHPPRAGAAVVRIENTPSTPHAGVLPGGLDARRPPGHRNLTGGKSTPSPSSSAALPSSTPNGSSRRSSWRPPTPHLVRSDPGVDQLPGPRSPPAPAQRRGFRTAERPGAPLLPPGHPRRQDGDRQLRGSYITEAVTIHFEVVGPRREGRLDAAAGRRRRRMPFFVMKPLEVIDWALGEQQADCWPA